MDMTQLHIKKKVHKLAVEPFTSKGPGSSYQVHAFIADTTGFMVAGRVAKDRRTIRKGSEREEEDRIYSSS